jgi:hypothetical protein
MPGQSYSPPAAWKIKPARELAVGDSICSLGIVSEIEPEDEDGFLVVEFDPRSPGHGLRLIWDPDDPVVVLAHFEGL